MNIEAYCKLHNTLGSLTEVQNSAKGVNGVPNGVLEFRDGKFHKGVYTNNVANYVTFDYRPDEIASIIEVWFIAEENSADIPNNKWRGIFSIEIREIIPGDLNELAFYYYKNVGIGRFELYIGNNINFVQLNITKSFSIGDEIHFFIVWDTGGIAGSTDIVRIYMDGIQNAQSIINAIPIWGINKPLFYIIGDHRLQHFCANTLDNLKIYSVPYIIQEFINNIIANMNNEGWVPIETVVCEKTLPQILILSNAIDIYDKVNKIIQVQEKKTFRRDKLIVNSISQRVKNFDNYFSVDNPESIFSNIKWRFDIFKIINTDGETIWDGIIQDIIRNHKTKYATIKSVDQLYKFQKIKLSYESSDWETPAEAFKNICDQEGFTAYNIKSIQDSINQQEANACRVKCYFGKDDDTAFQPAIEKLGDIGCADVYTHKNEIYYQHWQAFTGGVKINLTEDDIETAPIVSSGIKDIINDYRIGYILDKHVPAIDSANNNIGSVSRDTYGVHSLPEIDGSANQQIEIESLPAAVYIGECYIRRTHKNIDIPNVISTPLTIINFDIKETQPDWIDLRTYFSLTLSDEAWDEKIFEIFGTTINYDNNKIKILAYEVD